MLLSWLVPLSLSSVVSISLSSVWVSIPVLQIGSSVSFFLDFVYVCVCVCVCVCVYVLIYYIRFVVVQSLSCVRPFETLWTTAHQASLVSTNSQSLLKLRSIESMMSSNHLILCHSLLLLPSIFPSIRIFSNELAKISGGQSIGPSVSASVLPMNIQGWFPLGWLVCSPWSPRDSRESSPTPQLSGIKYIYNIVQPSPPTISIVLFILENWNTLPIKQ